MNDYEKSKNELQVMIRNHSHIRKSDAEWDAIQTAIDALEEVQKRVKGCEYCTGDVDERPMLIEDISVYIDGNNNLGTDDDGDVKINYCPMCGRKLEDTQ